MIYIIKIDIRLLTWKFFVGQFVHPVGGKVLKGMMEGPLVKPATSFTALEKMKIWCKIQVIINVLLFLRTTLLTILVDGTLKEPSK